MLLKNPIEVDFDTPL